MNLFLVGLNMNWLLHAFSLSLSFLVTGRLTGVAKQLQDDFPWLMPVACAAHRLALACRDASSEVLYMSTFYSSSISTFRRVQLL